MICAANKCSQGREPCTRAECGYDSLLSPQERCIFACFDRWGAPVATALVIVAAIALFVVANWQRLQMLWSAI